MLNKRPEFFGCGLGMLLLASCVSGLVGCAGVNDALTPSAETFVDQFDGRQIVRQASVSAASGLSEDFHTLGFEWMEKYPALIFVTVGHAMQIRAIQDTAFNADGHIFDNLKPASALTEFAHGASFRRFEMPLDQFRALARANVVKMRVGGINDYTVSSFGIGAGQAIVNSKFAPFLTAVDTAIAKSRR